MENEVRKLSSALDSAYQKADIAKYERSLVELKTFSQQKDFWQDGHKAGETMQEISRLEKRIAPWVSLKRDINYLSELVILDDDSLEGDIEADLNSATERLQNLVRSLRFSGPYDDHGAVIAIYAGAGGTDAQDWTQMLYRMYLRYFEKEGWKCVVVEESPGDEAGLKSVVFEVSGNDFIYGKLKNEHGVHRLVRLSPFNADHLRQTSFAKVEVSPTIDSPSEVDIEDKDLKIDVYRSGGHGGQSVNTTDSAVRVTHIPTGISVAIQNERSQLQNRETALAILRSRLVQLQIEQHAEKISAIKGQNISAEWGNQIRNYVLHPYKQVKDLRSGYESSEVDKILNGDLDALINA